MTDTASAPVPAPVAKPVESIVQAEKPVEVNQPEKIIDLSEKASTGLVEETPPEPTSPESPVTSKDFTEATKNSQDMSIAPSDQNLSIMLTEEDKSNMMMYIGNIYENGIKADKEKMLSWYTKSAENGNAKAQFLLATKLGEQEDKTKDSAQWLQKSAEGGYADAQYRLSLTAEKSDKIMWLTFAAQQQHVRAMFDLAYIYYQGDADIKNYQSAFKWLTTYIEKCPPNDLFAQAHHALGFMYYHGLGTEKDLEKAFKNYKLVLNDLHVLGCKYSPDKSISENNYLSDVYETLGDMYFYGFGTEQDYGKAFKNYVKADNKLKSGRIRYQLYLMHKNGWGIHVDNDKANELLKASAEEGFTEGLYQMGLKTCEEIIKSKHDIADYKLAVEYLEPATKNYHINACVLLALIYHQCFKFEESFKLLSQAKELTKECERADINYYLGYMYELGCHVNDNEKAIELYVIAVSKMTEDHHHGLPIVIEFDPNVLKKYDYELAEIKEDYAKAFRCCKTLVKYQNIRSKFIYAWLYWNGHGVEKNEKEASKWYCEALLDDKDNELKQIREDLKCFENEITVRKLTMVGDDTKPKEDVDALKKQIEMLTQQVMALTSSIIQIQKSKTVIVE